MSKTHSGVDLLEEQKSRQRTWLRVALLYQRVFRLLAERLAKVGLSVAQFDLLAQLVKAEPDRLKQSEIAQRLLVTKGNISGMLSRMTEQGTVKRVDDPKDRRSNRIVITDQGRALFEEGAKIQQHLVNEMFHGIDGERLNLLEEVVGQLNETFSQTMTGSGASTS